MSTDHEQRRHDPSAGEQSHTKKGSAPPHGDFKTIEGGRPEWRSEQSFTYTKTVNQDWKPGQGSNDDRQCLQHNHVDIDPYAEGRPAAFNYKLLIGAIIPRPIGFVSTRSADGSSTNLAPFSYTQLVNHDPPIFVIGFAGGLDRAKDTLRNIVDTKECVINMVSEHFIEAANATSVNAPYGISEWALTGLTPAPCKDVKPSRVREAVFSVEAKLLETREFDSKANPGKKSGTMVIVEGVRFWCREDAINDEQNLIDPAVLKPMSRLGGISYGRTTEGIELPRPEWSQMQHAAEASIRPKADGH